MQTNKNNLTDHPNLLQLTSLHPAEFMDLLSVFAPLCRNYFQHYDLEGNPRRIPKFKDDTRCSLPGSGQKLLFILIYMKENPRQHFHGQLFRVQQPRVSKWIKVLLPLLERALGQLKVLPKRFGSALYAFLQTFTRYVLLMDATERPIPRSVDYERQKHEYSGKKKAHTVTNNLIVDQQDQILFLSSTYPGSVHDKRLADEAGHCYPDNTVLIKDLGYQGYDLENISVLMPHKKTKNGELTQQQKQENTDISRIRVPVEHVMAGVKRLNIVREKVRLRFKDARDQVILIACGLHNMRTAARTS
ncbi:transposase [Catalinimonas alkaloidigena]|uniref:transposase n=1 Tax=Catalinimonas alkaloidigena TaxID=1075417 RepID=UPI0024069FC9|nr:transposase [Catalinimonas alkaloidigena]